MSGSGNDPSTILLAHFSELPALDTAVGGNAPHTLTTNGTGGVTRNTVNFQFAPSSISFNGVAGNNVTSNNAADLSWGASDFTVDFWINPNNIVVPSVPIAIGGDSNGFVFRLNSVKQGEPDIFLGGEGGIQAGWSTVIPANVWSYILLQRNGNLFAGYLNGIQQQIDTLTGTPSMSTTTGLTLGQGASEGTPFAAWGGLLDELRISKVARYPGNPLSIYVPTAPYIADFGTPFNNIMAPMMAQ